MKNDKIVIVGLDGGTWKNLMPLVKSGKMPFLGKLLKRSSYGVLESTIPSITSTAWTTFQTSVNLAKHGICGFFDYGEDLKGFQVFDSKDIKAKRIWEYLSDFGINSLWVNLPMSYPLDGVNSNSIIVSSFLTPEGGKMTNSSVAENILKEIAYKIDITEGGMKKGTDRI